MNIFAEMIREILGIEKSPEQLKREMKESNEENYRNNKLKVLREAREFKNKHKKEIEHRLRKPIHSVSLKELHYLGFMSIHLTRKHAEEMKL